MLGRRYRQRLVTVACRSVLEGVVGAHPDEATVFQSAMTMFSEAEAAAVTDPHDFSEIGTLVDVGGSQGVLLASILSATPSIRGCSSTCLGARTDHSNGDATARAGSVVLARSASLLLFVLGVILERWYLAGEQTPVLDIPVDRFE
jgi:hypothetical protein